MRVFAKSNGFEWELLKISPEDFNRLSDGTKAIEHTPNYWVPTADGKLLTVWPAPLPGVEIIERLVSVPDATTHSGDCDWHMDQYPWECTCGLLPRMTYAEWIAKRQAAGESK